MIIYLLNLDAKPDFDILRFARSSASSLLTWFLAGEKKAYKTKPSAGTANGIIEFPAPSEPSHHPHQCDR